MQDHTLGAHCRKGQRRSDNYENGSAVRFATFLAQRLRVQTLVVRFESVIGIYQSIPWPDFCTLGQCSSHV